MSINRAPTLRWFVLFPVMAQLLAAGCRNDSVLSPPKLRLGEETCAHCRMIISEGRFAAALAARDGQTAKFDDAGCLLEYLPTLPEPAARVWIGNSVNGEWIDGESAWIVRSEAIATPMASGIAAFATREEAERKAAEVKSAVLRVADLTRASDARPEFSPPTTPEHPAGHEGHIDRPIRSE